MVDEKAGPLVALWAGPSVVQSAVPRVALMVEPSVVYWAVLMAGPRAVD